ncbi:hypothetical protein [uncultured Thiodictyon sp.]|uniref:hypothetical protein n=1 Tax=uncultured Thiodictyon sp. TaxID=1846217 RepID=UPI0025FE0594|nr:hypothetical protein [uncultured Thiodictyon sp.]
MNQDRLANLIERPEVQQMILNDYDGGYALGITLNPRNRSEIAIRVRIEGAEAASIPSEIILEGETIPIIANTNFKVPDPLNHR